MWRFQFESWHQAFWMNGHGPYVWGAYAIVLLALVFLVTMPIVRQKRLMKAARMSAQRENLRRRQ